MSRHLPCRMRPNATCTSSGHDGWHDLAGSSFLRILDVRRFGSPKTMTPAAVPPRNVPTPNVGLLQEDVQTALDAMRPFVESASDIAPGEFQGFLSVVRRAVLRRQFDSLEAISHLVGEGRGYAAPPLLRPICEELIWISYLARIDSRDAEELVCCRASIELLELLEAQHAECGSAAMRELGLLQEYERNMEGKQAMRARIRALGEMLGWPVSVTRRAQSPSVSLLANKTGRKDVYDYIYCATSRFVHFSAHGLLRLAWYDPGGMSVRSVHLRDYWAAFSLQWGFRLFLDSVIELLETPGMPEGEIRETDLLSTAERIGAFGKVPIITADELAVPE